MVDASSSPDTTRTGPTKSLDPSDRLGVYKRLTDVPDRYRLHQQASAFADRDVWQEFCEAYEYHQASHDRYEEEVDRVGAHWRAFMTTRERHHALATPADVEAWCGRLLEEFSTRRAYDYWLRVNRFYDWLQWHTEYSHVYNPALMATVDGAAAGEIWARKAAQNRDRRDRYREATND